MMYTDWGMMYTHWGMMYTVGYDVHGGGERERGPQDSKQSVSLLLSEEPGENSEPPSGASAGTEPPSGSPAPPVSPPQSSLIRLGPFLQARSALE
jgi:hypothetical protein